MKEFVPLINLLHVHFQTVKSKLIKFDKFSIRISSQLYFVSHIPTMHIK